MPDDLAATLAGIRERSAAALEFPLSGFAEDSIRSCTQSAMDVPRLLAAAEAALKLADDLATERPGETGPVRPAPATTPPGHAAVVSVRPSRQHYELLTDMLNA